jgi:hypothetical protein
VLVGCRHSGGDRELALRVFALSSETRFTPSLRHLWSRPAWEDEG